MGGCNHGAPTPTGQGRLADVHGGAHHHRDPIHCPAGPGSWHDRPVSPLHVRLLGPDDGRPVLALHGITGHGLRWRGPAAELPEVRLVAVDLRGHGRSPWTPPWSLEQHVTDVLDTLDHLGVGAVPVTGHSFGGAVALYLARAARERVSRPVPVDPALGLDAGDMLDAAQETCAGESYADAEEARAELVRRWDGVPGARVDADLPTLLLPAAKAGYVRPEWVAQLGPLTTVQEFDTGHMVHLERPAEVAAAIRGFLA